MFSLFRWGNFGVRRQIAAIRVGTKPEQFESRFLPTATVLDFEPRAAADFVGAWVIQTEFGEGSLSVLQEGDSMTAGISYQSAVGAIQLSFAGQKAPSGAVLKLKVKNGQFGSELGTARIKVKHNQDNTLSGLVRLKVKSLDINQRVAFTGTRPVAGAT